MLNWGILEISGYNNHVFMALIKVDFPSEVGELITEMN
jgi:hypothetical protein